MKYNIKFESQLSSIKNIEEKNKTFDNLSDIDKKKEISWDILQLLKTEKLLPSQGYYWSTTLDHIQDQSENASEFQKNLLKISSKDNCSVCARGAVMLSTIRLGNKLHKELRIEKGHGEILQGFNMEEMYAMEDEYENNYFNHPYETNTIEKLANIFCNVITNGTFNEEDETNYLK